RASSSALRASLCDLSLVTDTGCSIRLPSAACETVGLKSQWGLIPLDGIFPLVPSLATVGPMGRTVSGVALLWSVMSGRPAPEPRLHGFTVGLLRKAPYLGDGRETEASDAADPLGARLARAGGQARG